MGRSNFEPLITAYRLQITATGHLKTDHRPPIRQDIGMADFQTSVQDDLLDKLVGTWHIVREFKSRKAENSAMVEWVLNHQFLRIHMKDVMEPPKYEGHIYIGFNAAENRYVAHWIDVFGGQFSETLGLGTREGNSISFRFQYPDGLLTNVFTYRPDSNSWISRIDQQDEAGEMRPFCVDTYSRK